MRRVAFAEASLFRRASPRYDLHSRAVPIRHPARRSGFPAPEATLTQHDPAEATESLLARCAARDPAALRQLYVQQSARLHGIALRITRQPALAADALQDAFVNVWQNAASYDSSRGSAEGWLTGIVRFRALDVIRRGAREVTGLEMPDVADDEPSALNRLVGSAEAQALRRCLDALDAEKRRLVLLAFMDGLTHQELAARLAIPLGTVKSSIRRGLAGLRLCLEPGGFGPQDTRPQDTRP